MMREEADYLVERDADEEAESVNEREETSSEEEEEEEELELGLSLRVKKKNKITSGNNKDKNKWGRILTAKDFPTARSRASPISSSSSSSPASNRVPDPGSANPPSQIVVGWPPIRAFRINSFISSAKDNSASEIDEKKNKKKKKKKSAADQCIHSNKQKQQQEIKSTAAAAALRFVKVKMDGDPIGRKVDLSAHHSYDTLALALEIMFRKPTIELCSSAHSIKAAKWLDGSSEFALTYQDRDGDWMLLGDVPWGMFLDTVRRLRIMRTSDATGLAPRFQSSTAGLLRSNLPKNK